jgi:iron complex transport system substrate-binding protein
MGLNLETPAFFYEDIRALGKVLNSPERAEEIISYYQKIETEVSELLADLPETQRPSVLVLQYSADGGEISFKVPPTSYLQTTMVQNAGGNPVWLDADGGTNSWIQVGLEQIAVWNPEIIFVVNYAGDSVETVQELVVSPTWEGLKAVENQQVFGFPADYASWDLIDPRWILGQQWLATIIQPDLTTGINLETQVISFYQTLYGLSVDQINEFIFPRLDEIK